MRIVGEPTNPRAIACSWLSITVVWTDCAERPTNSNAERNTDNAPDSFGQSATTRSSTSITLILHPLMPSRPISKSFGAEDTPLHAAEGDWPVKPNPPFIPGHEGVGEGVKSLKVGDLVGCAWLWSACGKCQFCSTGWETLCEEQVNAGYSVDGSFGQYMLMDARYAARIPAGADLVQVAPILCAGVTVYKGLKMTEPRSLRSSSRG